MRRIAYTVEVNDKGDFLPLRQEVGWDGRQDTTGSTEGTHRKSCPTVLEVLCCASVLICLFIDSSFIYSLIHLFIFSCIIHVFIDVSIYLLIQIFSYLSFYSQIHLLLCLSIHSLIHLIC